MRFDRMRNELSPGHHYGNRNYTTIAILPAIKKKRPNELRLLNIIPMNSISVSKGNSLAENNFTQ